MWRPCFFNGQRQNAQRHIDRLVTVRRARHGSSSKPFALMLFSLNAVADWSPPPNRDPQTILRSAEEVSSRASQSFRWLPKTVTDQEKADATLPLAWFYNHADAIDY